MDSNEDMVIYCNEGSYAETYAIQNNIKYTTLVLDSVPNQTYTGKEIKPVPVVKMGDITLKENIDYIRKNDEETPFLRKIYKRQRLCQNVFSKIFLKLYNFELCFTVFRYAFGVSPL